MNPVTFSVLGYVSPESTGHKYAFLQDEKKEHIQECSRNIIKPILPPQL